ncbi:metallophosphoesterase [Vreelandella rituensis]|uniref:Calcineurin-like phosphoesterase domain-containing protein n=1 Tax=Vreelandella rituensis TaxID=2282306 RepID=A0A368TSV3_9GAMM|nr:metallophosphoesterase [Halomonas rituensis]RCV87416.1 hypothetical protein DU506_16655 [Halomonas rituensis]
MHLMLASDLHLEHFPTLSDVIPEYAMYQTPDILVLAGDIDNVSHLQWSLLSISDLFEGIPILFIPGNHEYYSRYHTMEEINDRLRGVERYLQNEGFPFHLLINDSVTIGGWHFFGGPMWSDMAQNAPVPPGDEHGIRMVDGHPPVSNDLRGLHASFREGLSQHLASYPSKQSIVISHFSPSLRFGNPLVATPAPGAVDYCRYFSADMDAVLDDPAAAPAAWLYGHTHYSMQERLSSGCLVASAQGGYPGERHQGLTGAFKIFEL